MKGAAARALAKLLHNWNVLRSNPRPLRFVLARILVVSGLCRLFVIKQSRNYRLRFFPSNLSEQLWVDRHWRDEPLAFFAQYLRRGEAVVDVGANIGDTSIVCALAVGPLGRVYSFEPHPVVFRWMRANIELNGLTNVDSRNLAIGDSNGIVSISNDRRDDMNRIVTAVGGLKVSVRPLDEEIPDDLQIDLLKIDVEGYELAVLRGASRTISQTKAIHLEVGLQKEDRAASRHALRLLWDAGFNLFRFETHRTIAAIDHEYLPRGVENVLAVRDVKEFESRLVGGGFSIRG